MAILDNFPLSYNDQADVIEIFDGLKQQADDQQPPQATTDKPISSPPHLLDDVLRRSPSDKQQ